MGLGQCCTFLWTRAYIYLGYNPQTTTNSGCKPSLSTSTGQSCAARIMELDNWQMKY